MFKRLLGDDIYLTYSRRDASMYAIGLADLLVTRGYSTFMDMFGTMPNVFLPRSLKKTLGNSSLLVVLSTRGALTSNSIADEITEFLKLRRPIVIIDFDHALQEAAWGHLVEGISVTAEDVNALQHGSPSDSVVYRLERTFTFTKRNERLRRIVGMTVTMFALLCVASVVLSYLLQRQVRETQRQLLIAKSARQDAQDMEAKLDELTRQLAEKEASSSAGSDTAQNTRRVQEVIADAQREAAQTKSQLDELARQLAEEKARTSTSADAQKSGASSARDAFLVVASLLLLYLTMYIILLYTRPLWILKVHSRLSLEKLIEGVDSSSTSAKLAKLLVTAIGLDYFARHARTRKAWLARYIEGEGRFSKLPPSIKAHFIENDDALDAWVLRHKDRAKAALNQISLRTQRSLFIHLPIEISGSETQRKDNYESTDFGYLFEKQEAVIEIVGQGGIGKSTLAAQFARWSLEANPVRRLTTHYMIPLFIEEEIQDGDIITSIKGHVRQMLGGDDEDNIDLEIIKELLRKKRMLVIIDGLSEKSDQMQDAVSRLFQTATINALVITTRYVKEFGPKPVTVLKPENISKENLYFFITEYLKRESIRKILVEEQPHEVCGHIMTVLSKRNDWSMVTPLVVKLLALFTLSRQTAITKTSIQREKGTSLEGLLRQLAAYG